MTIVGGTALTTAAGASWQSESVWNAGGRSSGGGIDWHNDAIPYWQQGISMSLNQGSTTLRNSPDVALVAENIVAVTDIPGYAPKQWAASGTSASCPLWAGVAALINQQAQANGNPPVGFLNPALYAIGKGPSQTYLSCFHDITSGNNGTYSAVAGYDLCTGWGTPNGFPLIRALAGPLSTIIGWWKGQNNTSDFMCTIGNGCCDAGVAEGGLAYAAGEVGKAFSFNGTDADVKVPTSSTLNLGAAAGLTIELWVNPANASAHEPLVEWNDGSRPWPAIVALWQRWVRVPLRQRRGRKRRLAPDCQQCWGSRFSDMATCGPDL